MAEGESRIVYKVVRVEGGRLTSCYAPRGWKKIYRIGRISKDRRSKLIAFFNLEKAIKFQLERPSIDLKILKCSAMGVTEPLFKTHPPGNSYFDTAKRYEQYWKDVKKGNIKYYEHTFPKDTAWCDSILPLKEVR